MLQRSKYFLLDARRGASVRLDAGGRMRRRYSFAHILMRSFSPRRYPHRGALLAELLRRNSVDYRRHGPEQPRFFSL